MSLENASLIVTPNAYKAGKLYSVIPEDGSGDFTASRATTATRVNENGIIESVGVNVPRIDYTNGNCPSILVEPQATNLLNYSEEFDNAVWTKADATITADDATAPDGTMTADKLVETASAATHILFKTAISTGKTFSIFAKKAERDLFQIRRDAGVGVNSYAWFDLNSGSVVSEVEGIAEIFSLNNEWYKCIFTPTSARGTIVYALSNGLTTREVAYQGDGTSGLFIWGAQLEEGTEPSSYIPTTTSAVTRNADVLSTTVPAGVTEIVEELEDGTTNTITNIPATYTPDPNRYKYILMQ